MKNCLIVEGRRTPFSKFATNLSQVPAAELGRAASVEVFYQTGIQPELIDEVAFGCIAQPANTANIARVIALRAGVPEKVPALTLCRNCASGMQAVSYGEEKIKRGEAKMILAGGTESMSNILFAYPKQMTEFLLGLAKAKSMGQKLRQLLRFRLSLLKPQNQLLQGLSDPVCGLNMGQTAELLAKELCITREEQDQFALDSHRKAVAAMKAGKLEQEIFPFPIPPKYEKFLTEDDGPRPDQSLESLAKLRPFFDRRYGTVTAGNSCPVTDGACAMLLAEESEVSKRNLEPLGRILGYAYHGLDPARMGLGPAYATPLALKRAGLKLSQIDLIEINEAFAAQVLANQRVFASAKHCRHYLGQDQAIGEINPSRLNVNGGAIALGHPVGTSGARLILTLLKELKRRQQKYGLASLCVGGGQGASFVLESC